jgi:hypothetical protein
MKQFVRRRYRCLFGICSNERRLWFGPGKVLVGELPSLDACRHGKCSIVRRVARSPSKQRVAALASQWWYLITVPTLCRVNTKVLGCLPASSVTFVALLEAPSSWMRCGATPHHR